MPRKASPKKRGRSHSRGPGKSPKKGRSKSRGRSKTPTRTPKKTPRKVSPRKALTSPRKTPRPYTPPRTIVSPIIVSAPPVSQAVRQRLLAAERSAASVANKVAVASKPVANKVTSFFDSVYSKLPECPFKTPTHYRRRSNQKWYMYRGYNVLLMLCLFALFAASAYFAYNHRSDIEHSLKYAQLKAAEQYYRLAARWYKKA